MYGPLGYNSYIEQLTDTHMNRSVQAQPAAADVTSPAAAHCKYRLTMH